MFLETQNIWCVYNNRLIFKDISFALKAGECLCIQGPNGSGKSSLLQMLAGNMHPYMGIIRLKEDIRLCTVLQPDGLTDDLTVNETENYWIELLGDAPTYIFSFKEQGSSLISMLSRGERQKLALNKLHHAPRKLWILDEPFTALDKHSYKALIIAMHHHIDRGGSIIFTSHESFKLPFKINHVIKLGASC